MSTLLDGKLQRCERIGYGMFHSQIFKAEHTTLGAVACKIIPVPPDDREAERCRHYVDSEIRCGALLKGQHIRRLLDHEKCPAIPELYINDGATILYFEWVPHTLSAIIGAGRVHYVQVLRLAFALARGLEEAHAQLPPIVHRDVKPPNVLVVDRDDLGTAKLADFGIARMAGDPSVTTTHAGTAVYMAPEQFIDSATATARADIYSLALLLWQLLDGQVPLLGMTEAATLVLRQSPELPVLVLDQRPVDQLLHIFRHALHADPNMRPQSALSLARSFADAGVTDGLWGAADVDAAVLTGARIDVERILFPVGRGDDKREDGGTLVLYLPLSADEILERVTPSIDWMYSLQRRAWLTTSLQVKADDVKRILQACDQRESARSTTDQIAPVPSAAAPPVSLDRMVEPTSFNAGTHKGTRLRPSPELARIVGSEPLPRFEVANRVWAYIREQRLSSPERPDRIRTDALLRTVFDGRDEITMREMSALLGRHLIDF